MSSEENSIVPDMQKQFNSTGNYQYDLTEEETIDIKGILLRVYKARLFILIVVFLAALLSIWYSLTLPNIYQAHSKLAPAASESSDSLSALSGQFGGLASLAGISLGGESSNAALAMEIMTSRQFIIDFINKYDLKVELFASEGWNHETDELIIDEDIYLETEEKWVREVSYPKRIIPSSLESYEEFLDNLKIAEISDAGTILVSFTHVSPSRAKIIVESLIEEINNKMKHRDEIEARKSISYLTKLLDETNISGHQALLYQLIEEQTKKLMFTSVRDEYAFEIIDPAILPEEKYKPKRAVIVITATALGFIFSLIMLYGYHLFLSFRVSEKS